MADNNLSSRNTRKRRCPNILTYAENSEQSSSQIKTFRSNDNDRNGNEKENQGENKDEKEELVEKLRSAEELNDKQSKELEDHRKEMKKLKTENQKLNSENQSICLKLEATEKKLEVISKSQRTDNETIVDKSTLISSPAEKSFVLKHVFTNVSTMQDKRDYFSTTQEHFGVPWSINIYSNNKEDFGVFLYCEKPLETGKWSIEETYEFKLTSTDGRCVTEDKQYKHSCTFGNSNGNRQFDTSGIHNVTRFEQLKKLVGSDDKLHVEVHVRINKMTGIYKDNLRCFDKTMEEVSDVILVVKDQKFYVSKLFLAAHSEYFKTLFLGQFQESKKSEINLTGIDADDFQNYLEVLYGEDSIDEVTVEGVLLIADMYDTLLVTKKCENFLLKESKKSLKKKLEMAMRFNLKKLKEKCLSEIKTTSDIRALLSGNLQDMDPSLMALLLEKAIFLR